MKKGKTKRKRKGPKYRKLKGEEGGGGGHMCIDQTMEEDMALKIGNYDDYGEEGVASTYIWTSWGEGHMYVNYRVIFPSIICLYEL